MTATTVQFASSAKPHSPITKHSLSYSRQQLLLLLQTLNFGRIEGLQIRGGEPILDPMPRRVRSIKFGGDNQTRPEALLENFVLREQHLGLLRLLDEIGDGTIAVLTCQHGLPFSAEVNS